MVLTAESHFKSHGLFKEFSIKIQIERTSLYLDGNSQLTINYE